MTVIINGTNGITSVNGSASAPSVTGTDTDTGIVYGTNTMSLATGGTTAVTVDSNQYVGVGITPTVRLQILGAASGAAAIFGVGTNGNGGIVWRNASNASVGYISVNSDNTDYRTTNDSTGAFLQKPGLTFPATQFPSADANTLDDYEEGTFTVAVTGTGTAGTWTPAYNGGIYTKVGRLVSFSFVLGGTLSGASGNIRITGLPFTVGASGQTAAVNEQRYIDITGYTQMGVEFVSGTTQGSFYMSGISKSELTLPVSGWGSGGATIVWVSGSYFV